MVLKGPYIFYVAMPSFASVLLLVCSLARSSSYVSPRTLIEKAVSLQSDPVVTDWLGGISEGQCIATLTKETFLPTWSSLSSTDPRRQPRCRQTSKEGDNGKLWMTPIEFELAHLQPQSMDVIDPIYINWFSSSGGQHNAFVAIPKTGSTSLRGITASTKLATPHPQANDHMFALFRNPISRAIAAFATITQRRSSSAGSQQGMPQRQRFATFVHWSWTIGLTDFRDVVTRKQQPAGSLPWLNLHQLSQMLFLNIYRPAQPAPREVNLSGHFEYWGEHVDAYFKSLEYPALIKHLNVKEGGDSKRSDLDSLPCPIIWQLVLYYQQDFVCFNYSIPTPCLASECRPSWIREALDLSLFH